MPAFVKTKRDEELWAKAKARAAEEGRPHDWPFVTGIYKNMKGGKVGSGTLSWASLSQERKKLKRKSFAQKFLREEGSAGRLRELGRSLAVAGSRPPRAQMVTIAATLDGLLDQLKQLGGKKSGPGIPTTSGAGRGSQEGHGMKLLARGAAFGGLGVFLLGGVLLGCGVLIIRAAHDHLERS